MLRAGNAAISCGTRWVPKGSQRTRLGTILPTPWSFK